MTQDRRGSARILVQLPMFGAFDGVSIPLNLADVSMTGVRVRTSPPWPLNSEVHLTLSFENGTVETMARVVRHVPGGVALSFVDAPEAFTEALARELKVAIQKQDRRRSARVPGSIALIQDHASGARAFFSLDLSHHGAFLRRDDRLVTAAPILISEHGLYETAFVVRRESDEGVAIEFINPTPRFLEAVTRIYNALEQEEA